ncbi:uncharacterized protein LOC124484651 [Hypomesus transpacificus]|uniref:uncharacterized protein LOC124484651 n=1 Tax=Hypomesus transpacificus TaxID=137520 RepID=UPI001F07DA0C|nr:uncharacterized protein LOC124484651 [Hypomesus transpacificus]
MLVLCVAAVLGLLSAGQAAPLTCEALVKPLENTNLEMLLGKWMVIGETSQVPGSRTLGKLLFSSGCIEFTATSDSNRVIHTQIYNTLGVCYSVRFNMTLQDNAMNIAPLDCVLVLLKTDCPDCLLIQSSCKVAGETFLGLELFSRRRGVTSAELDNFKKQAECLSLHRPLVLSPQNKLCPHPDFPTDKTTSDLSDFLDNDDVDEELTTMVETHMKRFFNLARFLENAYYNIFPDSKK